jgi:hypothetical protein
MSRLRFWQTVLIVPALVAMVAIAGCGSDDKKPASSGGGGGKSGGTSDKDGKTASKSGDKQPFEVKETGTLKGKVTYAGTPPKRESLKGQMEKLENAKDREVCLSGDTESQAWIVDPDGGVANVVVFLRAPDGKYFHVPEANEKREDAVMDQPHCAFVPHVVAFNPSVFDPAAKKQKKTGQIFKVLNSAPMNHNTAYGGDPLLNPNKNEIIASKKDLTVNAKPCKDTVACGEELLNISCDIHKWMTAKATVFDHPYYAVTKADGSYEIKNVPAGTEVVIAWWHESLGGLKDAKPDKITLKAGENTKDFKIK